MDLLSNGLPVGWALVPTHIDDGRGVASSLRVAQHCADALAGKIEARNPTAKIDASHPPGYTVKFNPGWSAGPSHLVFVLMSMKAHSRSR